jgi:hypothetical protein
MPTPHPGQLITVIRRLAAARLISYAYHASDERMPERDFDVDDIHEVFRIGDIYGDIREGKNAGEWVCKVCAQPFGTRRWMGVVTVVIQGQRLRIITTEWEDRR